MRTNIYIDGFNLYYGSLKDTPYKWLDLKALFSRILNPDHTILAIRLYTAKVSAREDDRGVSSRQTVYHNALEAHTPELQIIRGRFLESKARMPVVNPGRRQRTIEVIKTEEKGSDVNLAVHVVNDAWHDRYDCAVICSNDSDLGESLKIIQRNPLQKRVLVVTPGDIEFRPTAWVLKCYSRKQYRISEADLIACQLPNPVYGIYKPKQW